MTDTLGMHGYCGGYWTGPVVADDGRSIDVCNSCGMERRHDRKAARRSRPSVRLGTAQVAERANVSPRTIASYAARGQMPKPAPCPCCGHSPTWDDKEIATWLGNRPGQGAGGGRPRKAT